MKAAIYVFLILGFFFWHPRHSYALDNNEKVFSHCSLVQASQCNEMVFGNSPNLSTLFDDDLFAADDDDVTISARKKLSLGSAYCVIFTVPALQNILNYSRERIPSISCFFHLPSPDFISLKVFRL